MSKLMYKTLGLKYPSSK